MARSRTARGARRYSALFIPVLVLMQGHAQATDTCAFNRYYQVIEERFWDRRDTKTFLLQDYGLKHAKLTVKPTLRKWPKGYVVQQSDWLFKYASVYDKTLEVRVIRSYPTKDPQLRLSEMHPSQDLQVRWLNKPDSKKRKLLQLHSYIEVYNRVLSGNKIVGKTYRGRFLIAKTRVPLQALNEPGNKKQMNVLRYRFNGFTDYFRVIVIAGKRHGKKKQLRYSAYVTPYYYNARTIFLCGYYPVTPKEAEKQPLPWQIN